jgi:hypothetical protein
MNVFKRNKRVLMALLLVFSAPGVFALLFYMHPTWLGELPTNKGSFVTPSVQFPELGDADDTWKIVVWCPSGCNTTCLKNVDDLARVRLALGRRLYQVSLWLVQGDDGRMCTREEEHMLKTHDVHARTLLARMRLNVPVLQDKASVFLVDPKQHAVLQYQGVNVPKDVFQDLKRLLNRQEQA